MNSMTKLIVQSFPGRSSLRRKVATTAGIAVILMAAIPVSAQFFPTEEPVEVFSDDFSVFTTPTCLKPERGHLHRPSVVRRQPL